MQEDKESDQLPEVKTDMDHRDRMHMTKEINMTITITGMMTEGTSLKLEMSKNKLIV